MAKKPTPTQLRIIANVAAGKRYDYDRPITRSDAAGWGCSYYSCIRRGWLDRNGNLTDEGRKFLPRQPIPPLESLTGLAWTPPAYRRIDAGSADAVPNGGHDPQGS